MTTQHGIAPVVQHFFVLMMENRSFDHVFGLSCIVGTDAATGAPTSIEGLVPGQGKNVDPKSGQVISTSLGANPSLRGVAPDVEHEFVDVLMQLCGPAKVPAPGLDDPSDVRLPNGVYPPIDLSGFVADFRAQTAAKYPDAPPEIPMQCFRPVDLPILNTLAREFAVCDHWHASQPGPTWPNRFFVHGASPTEDGLSDSPSNLQFANANTGVDKFSYPKGTIYDRLAEGGLTNLIFQSDNCAQVSFIAPTHAELTFLPIADLAATLQSSSFRSEE